MTSTNAESQRRLDWDQLNSDAEKRASDSDDNAPKRETSPRNVHGLLWATTVLAIYSSTFVFALDNTIVACHHQVAEWHRQARLVRSGLRDGLQRHGLDLTADLQPFQHQMDLHHGNCRLHDRLCRLRCRKLHEHADRWPCHLRRRRRRPIRRCHELPA